MIRRATHSDLNAIMTIVRSAQQYLAELGIDQWQDGYPEREVIASDIDAGIGFVVCDKSNAPKGYVAIVFSGEPAYQQIPQSQWHTSERYVVVHRICISEDSRRAGLAVKLMRFAESLAIQSGLDAMRIDTHEGNVRMLAMLDKLGFKYCGKILYEQGGERVAYDKEISLYNQL